MIDVKKKRQGRLEKFGLYYLNRFSINNSNHRPFDLTDEELTRKVRIIFRKGIILSAITCIVLVYLV